jgi:hypothetical protein
MSVNFQSPVGTKEMMAIRQDLPSLMGLMASARKYPELKLWAIFFENSRGF